MYVETKEWNIIPVLSRISLTCLIYHLIGRCYPVESVQALLD